MLFATLTTTQNASVLMLMHTLGGVRDRSCREPEYEAADYAELPKKRTGR